MATNEIALPDHAPPGDYATLLRQPLPVVCTEKDLFKLAECWQTGDPPVWAAPLELDLEKAMEFCAADECVEVTPEIVRVRKVELAASLRARAKTRAKQQANS